MSKVYTGDNPAERARWHDAYGPSGLGGRSPAEYEDPVEPAPWVCTNHPDRRTSATYMGTPLCGQCFDAALAASGR